MVPRFTRETGFSRWSGDGLELLCGNFFSLGTKDVGPCEGFYDRAALVALPREMRSAYAGQITRLSNRTTRGLLVTFDYNQQEMGGPPFSIPGNEVSELFVGQWDIHRLGSQDALKVEDKFKQRGLSRLEEQVFSLARTPLTEHG